MTQLGTQGSVYKYKISDDDKLMFHKFDSLDDGEKIGKAIHISNDFHFLLSRISFLTQNA